MATTNNPVTPGDRDEADLVVIGSGAAGLTAAFVAASQGASVIVLEKSAFVGGTTALSGGGVWIPCNHHMADVGVDDSRDEALLYLHNLAGKQADVELIETFVDVGPEMIRYLEDQGQVPFRAWPSIGGTLDYRPEVPGAKHGGRPLDPGRAAVADLGEWASRVRTGPGSAWVWDKFEFYTGRMHTAPPDQSRTVHQRQFVDVGSVEYSKPATFEYFANGTALVAHLLRACLEVGVDIRINCPAWELETMENRVTGVRVGEGGSSTLHGRHGVMLATGGFEFSEQLKAEFLNRPLEYSPGCPTNEGDGHLMGMAVGGRIANISDAWWCPVVPLGSDSEDDDCVLSREERALPHTMIVNARGARFVNESLNYHDITEAFGTRPNALTNLPAWLILDQQFKDRYALLKSAPPAKDPSGQPSWLIKADSVGDLAERLGIDPESLCATVERFNGFARSGYDADFRRGESTWDREWGDPTHSPNGSLGTIEHGPFYAVELRPGALATKGGLKIDSRSRVVAAARDQAVIPGLYAAGNVSSNAVPYCYTGPGSTLGPAMTFGYIVGREITSSIANSAHSPKESQINA